MEVLDNMFGVTEAGSTVETELKAGLATFLTMAYILLVNPSMLAVAGIPFTDALFATAIAAFVGCMAMAFWAKLPFALAPGMGLNAYFAFTVAAPWAMAIPWEVALGAVFVEGLIFLIISHPSVGWRTKMINSIPTDLKIATGAGIGMFLAIIGLREMGWIMNDAATLVNLGPTETFTYESGALWAMVGLILIAVMMARGIQGAIIYGIAAVTLIGWGLGVDDPYNMPGLADDGTWTAMIPGWGAADVSAPAIGDIVSTDGFSTGAVGAALGALSDVGGDVPLGEFLLVMITFLFVDIFDTAGTLYSVGRQAGYVDENDELMNSDEAFMSDAAATVVGALCGTSTTTTYIESAAGIEEGGKTGLTAATVGVLMLSGLFFANLFAAVPQYAMASALVIVGALMMRQAADINWSDSDVALPAFVTMVLMPFTYSIADGIAWGIILYVAMKIGQGKMDQINQVMAILAALMAMFYLGPGTETTFEYLIGGL
ncbi:MAG: NCS2 family permease [Candidatus Thalassarchaeaceae archaeon]|jgi:AGZA family xanthine/uracil permease-like MFS transporter|nr:NCS2 family permease [Candidatus Thalassarchaeaceae archaeon]